jgi:hypothetical protein
MNFIITQLDIDGGKARNPAACPLARCIRRSFDCTHVRVFPEWVQVDVPGKPITDKNGRTTTPAGTELTLPTTDLMRLWMADYDAGRPVKPMSFPLEMTNPVKEPSERTLERRAKLAQGVS